VIYDILEVFNKKYEEEGEKFILDNYVLKDGLYIKIGDNEKCEIFIKKSKKDNKKSRIEHFFLDEDNINKTNTMEWFKIRDYYSNVIEAGKTYDAPQKTILNNNYLTLFMKNTKFLETKFDYIKTKLFDKITDFASFKSENEKLIVSGYNDYIQQPNRKSDIEKKAQTLKTIFNKIQDIAKQHSPKEYIKIFFDENEETYKQESSIYISLKIYNKNEYSKNVDGVIYGLSNYNMGLNGKKPFLEHKTKKLPYPFMIKTDIALKIKIFFDWLGFQEYRTDLLPSMFLSKYSDNGEAIIKDFDYLPEVKTAKNDIKILKKPIKVINFVKLKDKDSFKEDYEITKLDQLEKDVSDIFYNGHLLNNYYDDVYNKIDEKLANLIYITRGAMINYFKKYREYEFYQAVKKFGTHFIIGHLRRNNNYKAKESLNLKLSLIKHNKGDIVDINALQNKVLDKLKSSDYSALNEEEFSYLSGQIVTYLLGKSEKYEKNADLLEPFLRTNGAKRLKENIKSVYFKYKHAAPLKYMLLNNAITLVLAYEVDDESPYDTDNFLIGVLSNNILYTSTKTEEN
jgi:CRISPR-associated protein Csh1